MNSMGIGIVNNWRRQRGPDVRKISCQSTENLEGHMSLTEMTQMTVICRNLGVVSIYGESSW